ncbi:stress-response A/B barrel domain-containing protein UP3 isoform X2 [Telopea speciosissima]|uniref:stress-response A/B barrel domain-containing protein UP3 isoform X2 n=1 Tax=Telopea speciosissima TaxID=54955 RepID=UPI001CC827D7|nr:stress-response A/B barrel domain-containing protein UP3 isoform X2 [Telopea speciosissima]
MSFCTNVFSPLGIHLHHCFVGSVVSAVCVSSKAFSLYSSRFLECDAWRSFNVSKLNGFRNDFSGRQGRRRVAFAASEGSSSGSDLEDYGHSRKRKVVEHICLLKANRELSEEEENDMLDYLYTSQYQMGGIVAISLGRLSEKNPDGYTHAVYLRFQRQEDLAKFYKNSFYLGVLKDHVMPYCHGLIYVDYESEVEDDILPIFRKGEEFNYGLEFVLLISVVETGYGGPVDDALATLAKLPMKFPSLIVQVTQGSNFNNSDTEYTHGAVIRFRSIEAFEIFVGSSEYKDMWKSKFQPITQKSLAVHFSVDPVGTEIM